MLGLGFSLWTLAGSEPPGSRPWTRGTQGAVGSEQKPAGRPISQGHAPGRRTLPRPGPGHHDAARDPGSRPPSGWARICKDQPEVEAELSTTLGDVYEALGLYDQAEVMYRQALALRQALWGLMNTNVADSLDILGQELRNRRGEAVESQALLNQALLIRTQLPGPGECASRDVPKPFGRGAAVFG